MRKKAVLLGLSLILALGAVLSACGSGNTKSANNGPEEIKITLLSRADTTPMWTAIQERLDQFETENPGVTIDHQAIPTEETYNTKLKTTIASGDTPDLFINLGGAAFKEYAKNNVVADLSAVLEEDQAWKNDFLPLFDNWQFDDLEGTYGIPLEFYGVGIFYNKDLFEQVGVQEPKTIEEFLAICDKFKQAGIIPMALGEKDSFRAGHLFNNLLMKTYGTAMIDSLANRSVAYDDPQIVSIFSEINAWNEAGIFGSNIVGTDYNAEKALFHNEKTAMHMDGSWYISEAQSSSIKDKLGFFPFPYYADKPENENIWMGGAPIGLSISAELSGKKKEVVVKLLKYMTSREQFSYIRSKVNGGIYPVKLDEDSSLDPFTIMYSGIIAKAEDFRADVQSYDPLPQILDKARNSMQGMLAGQSPESAVKQIADEVAKSSK